MGMQAQHAAALAEQRARAAEDDKHKMAAAARRLPAISTASTASGGLLLPSYQGCGPRAKSIGSGTFLSELNLRRLLTSSLAPHTVGPMEVDQPSALYQRRLGTRPTAFICWVLFSRID